MSRRLLDDVEREQALGTLNPDWSGTSASLTRSIEFADFPTAAEFVSRLAPVCEELDHHPDLVLRWRWVDISLTTHDSGGVTARDVALAEAIDEIAATLPLAGLG